MKLLQECCSRSSGDRGLSRVHTVFGVPFMAVNAAPHFWEAMSDSMQRSGVLSLTSPGGCCGSRALHESSDSGYNY